MANVKVLIDILSDMENSIDDVTTDEGVNNVSKPFEFGTTERNSGFHCICLAQPIENWGYPISEETGYNGYMFGVTDENGYGDLELEITGTDVFSVIFYGDRQALQYPVEAVLDEGTPQERVLYSDDYIWALKFAQKASTHTLKFTKWNRGNYNMCITHIEAFPGTLELGAGWINSVNTTTQRTNDPKEPSFTVLPNFGDVEILDRHGEILDYVDDGLLDTGNFTVTILVNGREVQRHSALMSEYVKSSMTFNVELSNQLTQWSNIMYDGYTINAGSSVTAWDLLVDMITTSLPELDETDVQDMCGGEIIGLGITRTVETLLKYLLIPAGDSDLNISKSSLRTSVEKICALAQLQVYENDEGEIRFVNDRPYVTQDELDNAKVIPLKMQMSSLEHSVLITNAYTDVVFV